MVSPCLILLPRIDSFFLPPIHGEQLVGPRTFDVHVNHTATVMRIPAIHIQTDDDLWQAVGRVCDLFSQEECYSFFRSSGYEAN